MWSELLVGGIFFFLVALYYNQHRLLYYPQVPSGSRTNFYTPTDANIPLNTFEDNVKLQGYLVKQPNPKEAITLIFFHGNAGNLSHRLPNIKELVNRCHVNVFILSYRGYGKSEGSPSENGLIIDAKSTLDYLSGRPDLNNKFVLFGRSLGGAVAIALASDAKYQSKLKALIVENSFISIPHMVDVVMPIFKYVKFLITNKWDSINGVNNINIPVLYLSGLKDSLVPSSHMKLLYDNTSSLNKKIVTFENGEHMDLWIQPNYYNTILNFLDSL